MISVSLEVLAKKKKEQTHAHTQKEENIQNNRLNKYVHCCFKLKHKKELKQQQHNSVTGNTTLTDALTLQVRCFGLKVNKDFRDFSLFLRKKNVTQTSLLLKNRGGTIFKRSEQG